MGNDWTQVDRLVSEQKFEEAAALVAKIRAAAQKSGDAQEWTRALVREVQLRTALHGYENAVTLLKEPWPEGALNHTVLDLVYARTLVNYYYAYSYDVNRRERVSSSATSDLKTLTRDQIYAEAQRAYAEVWKARADLGSQPIARLGDYVEKNNYPEKVRGTLRDAISYFYVELLADTTFWRPEESNVLYRLDLKALMAGSQGEVPLEDSSVHPISKAAYILEDLERWHTRNGRPEAALEARLELLRRLHGSFTEAQDRTLIVAELERILARNRSVTWWSAGKALEAEFVRQQEETGKLVRAHRIAEEGWKAYPDSVGGRRCLSILRSIDAPLFELSSMSADGAGRRSLQVVHANMPALYFRAYSYDLEGRLRTAQDYNLLPNGPEQEKILGTRKPAAEWRVDLPPTPDYESHRTFVTPPLKSPGFYIVFASATASFSRPRNRLLATSLLITDLVLVSSYDRDSAIEVRTLSGATGNPVAGAEVELWRLDWQKGHQRIETRQSDAQGAVRFSWSSNWDAQYFLFARYRGNVALDPEGIRLYWPREPDRASMALVYTDRSVYRPMQKTFWKVLVYGGARATGQYRTLASQPVTVSLLDANHEVVETRTVTTNQFGSVAGEFSLPAGRLLGAWHIQTAPAGEAQIRVEEYKRPTFEVTLKDPEGALRLNRPAKFAGEARYYFGLPVVNGNVRWRATREPVYPYWWSWFAPEGGQAQSQTVAAGSTPLHEDGTFAIEFTPAADERKAAESRDISYRYSVAADVTDEGGETRSASRKFRLGFVAVEGRIDLGPAFLLERTAGEITISRTDLNGVPRPGKGTWRLATLRQPAAAVAPSELPVVPVGRGLHANGYRTPGDALRPRWDTHFSWKAILRGWPEGNEQAKGSLEHASGGQAAFTLPPLPPGAYRLHYETVDDFGEACRVSEDFIVAASRTPVALPAVMLAERTSVKVGETARFLVHSGLPRQALFVDIFRDGHFAERRRFTSGQDSSVFELPVRDADRGGFSVRLSLVADHQFVHFEQSVFVPWDDKELKVEFATFRDKLRPGGTETWRVTVKGPAGKPVEANAAELLAYMYDRSLDVFAPHHPPTVSGLYPSRAWLPQTKASLGQSFGSLIGDELVHVPPYPELEGDRLKFDEGYGIGGPGRRRRWGGEYSMAVAAPMAAPVMADRALRMEEKSMVQEAEPKAKEVPPAAEAPALRSDFAETAFWRPQLLTDNTGSATIEFTVPDSVTSWNVWVHAVTRDLKGGSLTREARSVKELMVRPYLPRFLREGDKAELKIVVNNASDREFRGNVSLDILDPENQASVLSQFGVQGAAVLPFTVRAGGGANVTFPIVTPVKVGTFAFKVTATSGDVSDGELRPLPVLPGRMHLSQSRFVTLKDKDRRDMTFAGLKETTDPSLINEQLVVTLDAQLFYSVLSALPYLVTFPYECTEQTLNRFVSTGILTSLYDNYPAVSRMAQEFSHRDTPLETWDSADPNRKMGLEETPWLEESRGGKDFGYGMANVLDPRIAKAERISALAKLRKSQTSNGGFPWWAGGPPSPYMTLYLMYGFAKAAEFGVDVPTDMVQRGWAYLAQHFREEYASRMLKENCSWEWLTFLNYTASCYPDPSWMGSALTARERTDILNHSFKHWKEHSPYLKCQLALTLKRMGRPLDAELVFASVMDSARTSRDEGTYWAPEDRAWLWYNDRIETHAFALRTVMELTPEDKRKDGLVHWLFLNKKLNHWKSTRATAEVIYSLVHYLRKEGALGTREDATVRVGGQTVRYVFEPDQYTGKKNQTVIPGAKLDSGCATIAVEKESKGLVFASATWQFSTERLPTEESGDFLFVRRTYFQRVHDGRDFTLRPLAEGAVLRPGDEIEVQLSIRARHQFEYVHLRDPRAAGLEPENAVSRFRWDRGIAWYEETRDSGTNFFIEWLPQGEYTLRYRLRANLAGTFKVGPATLQSMYAPEFTAYSAGAVIRIL